MKTRDELVSWVDQDSGKTPYHMRFGPFSTHEEATLSCWVCCCGFDVPIVIRCNGRL